MGVNNNNEGDQIINKNAADVALEWVKQIIALSSGIVALSATFLRELGTYPCWILLFLVLSWLCFISSIITGLNTISSIVQSHLKDNNNWNTDTGLGNAIACKYLFIIGVCLFCVFALLSVLL